MEMPEPTSEHEWLLQLVGDWTFESECVMGPDQPHMISTGKQTTRSLGSLWTLGEMENDSPDGQPMRSVFTLGFDPAKHRFVGTFVASCMTHLWPYDGQLDAARKVLTLDSLGPSFAGDGTMAKYQDIIEVIDKDHYLLVSQLQNPDGSWTQFMSAKYTRVTNSKKLEMKGPNNTVCIWYAKDAVEAAGFYAQTFPDSSVGAMHRAPSDNPSSKEGDVLTVEFTVLGIPCIGLNGGPGVDHSWAFSFQVATADQAETDRYWNAIVGNGGEESQCGWCKDKWGVNWQITPIALTKAFTGSDRAAAKRAFDAMMTMKKIDVAAIETAVRG